MYGAGTQRIESDKMNWNVVAVFSSLSKFSPKFISTLVDLARVSVSFARPCSFVVVRSSSSHLQINSRAYFVQIIVGKHDRQCHIAYWPRLQILARQIDILATHLMVLEKVSENLH